MKEEIIDYEIKGNLVRFYLGENGKQWGDDWDDAPYEHNAGRVYEEFVKGYKDIFVEFEKSVFEPSNGHNNSQYTKEDMVKRKVPCIIVANEGHWTFESALADDSSIKYYFGDLIK